MPYKTLEITLPSGRKVNILIFLSAGDIRKLLDDSAQISPRGRFVDLVVSLGKKEGLTAEEVSLLPDDELERIGKALLVGDELNKEFDATEGPDFYVRFISAHKQVWEKQWDSFKGLSKQFTDPLASSMQRAMKQLEPYRSSLEQAVQLSKMVQPYRSSLEQAAKLSEMVQRPVLGAEDILRTQKPILIDRKSFVPDDVKLLLRLIESQEKHAGSNMEVQKQIAETLLRLVDDSAKATVAAEKAEKRASKQQTINIIIAALTLLTTIITLVITA